MPKEEREKEIKKQDPSPEDIRKMLKNDLGFIRDVTNYVKQMTDNGCINPMLASDIKNQIEEQVRTVLALPAKPAPPIYQPPQPATPPGYAPGQPPQYPPRPG